MLGPTAAGNAPAGIGHAEPISRATARRPARARSAMWSMRPQRLTKDRRQKAHTGYRGLAIPLGRPGARWSGSRASQSSLAVPLGRPRTRSGSRALRSSSRRPRANRYQHPSPGIGCDVAHRVGRFSCGVVARAWSPRRASGDRGDRISRGANVLTYAPFREGCMRRRSFIAALGGVAAWPLTARAQQASLTYRLGYLSNVKLPLLIAALQTGLHDLGYVAGQNLTIEYRFAEGRAEMLDSLAAELVRLRPDVIVTVGTSAVLAVERRTTTIPIVMATAGDPLRSGLAASLARPGGNVTGVTLYGSELAGKRLEVLKEAIPNVAHVAVLDDVNNPASEYYWEETRSAGQALGVDVLRSKVKELDELSAEFSSMTRNGAEALIVLSSVLFNEARRQIVGLAAEHRLTASYDEWEFAQAGG